uniref:Uncharacterized protein n=1 Tax=Arundo donax TaxID=35708 RepID=A0A0A9GH99_ARUDO
MWDMPKAILSNFGRRSSETDAKTGSESEYINSFDLLFLESSSSPRSSGYATSVSSRPQRSAHRCATTPTAPLVSAILLPAFPPVQSPPRRAAPQAVGF